MVLVEGTEKYILITIVIHLDIFAMEDDKGSEDTSQLQIFVVFLREG